MRNTPCWRRWTVRWNAAYQPVDNRKMRRTAYCRRTTKFAKCVLALIFLCTVSAIIYGALIAFPRLIGFRAERNAHYRTGRRLTIPARLLSGKRNFTNLEVSQMSCLGKWLLSPEGSAPPQTVNTGKEPFLILVWKHGLFLERRHIRRFSNNKYSPWDGCSVNNCLLSYKSEDLDRASAVVFHLHRTKNVSELPRRRRFDQRWIFLTDEVPLNTFLYRNQSMSDYNGLFNWSMTYRMDSDIPVPYGRTIIISEISAAEPASLKSVLKARKTKLVAIMGSNCGGHNNRWNYARELKRLLGDDLSIYGRCLGGNTTVCPGHFANDCPPLDEYKFYLAFENSNCREYLTEKVFWNGYRKFAIPIIMGPPKNDCVKLLPPNSFVHVDDYASPSVLARYIQYLHRHDDDYFEYHEWRDYYKVVNEHGYFGSASRHYCRVCEALHYNSPATKIYENVGAFWNKETDCART